MGTKADKISKGHWQKHAKIVKDGLGFDPRDSFVVFSSETGKGREELWEIIRNAAGLPAEETGEAPKE
ncbi:putative GTP-binding protein EngB [compost metagenome]